MLMLIYISHASSFNFAEELYKPIKKGLGASNFIFPHEDLKTNPYDVRKLFNSGKCSQVIAEVSYPSTGQGIELAWAEHLNIKINCIYNSKATPSSSLEKVSDTFFQYNSTSRMLSIIEKITLSSNP